MSERTTRKDVEDQVRWLRESYERLGLVQKSHEWILVTGSKTYGQAWRLFLKDPKGSGHMQLGWLPQGFLGMTAAEAVGRLQVIREVIRWLEYDEILLPDQEV